MILIATILILALTLWLGIAIYKTVTWLEREAKAGERQELQQRYENAERDVCLAMAQGDVDGLRQALDVYGEAAAKME